MPKTGDPDRKGEGVGIVMSPEATRAWRDGGEIWEADSSRMISARIRLKCGKY